MTSLPGAVIEQACAFVFILYGVVVVSVDERTQLAPAAYEYYSSHRQYAIELLNYTSSGL